MRFLNYFSLLTLTVLFFGACQNELDPPPSSPAQITLQDANGDCYPSDVQGVYKKDSALTSANFLNVTVSASVAGTYNLSTDTINGYYFQGNGTVSSPGMTTLMLRGYGTPIAVGTDVFHIRMDTSVCEITVQVVSSTTPAAVFTFGTTAGDCTGAVLAGTFTAGTAMAPTNTVTLNITVGTAGTYNITTPVVNNVSFSGSGTLTSSSTSIVLTANGTPAASTSNTVVDYPVTAGISACNFSVTYLGVPAGPASFTFDCSTFDGVISSPVVLRVGIPLDPATTFVTVDINVITAGSYTITSAPSLGGPDGVSFNTTGTFATTGPQTLTLYATGTPQRPFFVFYNVSSPQATNPTPCSTGAYYDNLIATIGSTPNRNFTFSSLTTNDNTSLAGYDQIRMKGFASATSNESLELIIGLPTGGSFNLTSGPDHIYTVNDFPAKYVKAIYSDGSAPQVIYSAETNGTIQTNPFTITITFCTAGRIEGNFSGVVKDNNGAGPGTKTISGSFGLKR